LRTELYYSFSQPLIRSPRTRTMRLRDIVPPTLNWRNKIGIVGVPAITDIVQIIGISNEMTLTITNSSPLSVSVVAFCSGDELGANIISSASVSAVGNAFLKVRPGAWVFFEGNSDIAGSSATITIKNWLNGDNTLDTFNFSF
jgi:hypothetical protein